MSSRAALAEQSYQSRRSPKLTAAETAYQQRTPGSSWSQRAKFSVMTGEDQAQYMNQTFGLGNARKNSAGDWEVKKNQAWVPFDVRGFDWGSSMVGPAIEYVPAAVGAFAASPVIGTVLGQVGGSAARQAAAEAILGGSQKTGAQVAGETALAGGEALLGGALGKAVQGAVNLAKPGYTMAKQALAAPGTLQAIPAHQVAVPPKPSGTYTRIPPPKTTNVPKVSPSALRHGQTEFAQAELVDEIPWASAQYMSPAKTKLVREQPATNPVIARANELAAEPPQLFQHINMGGSMSKQGNPRMYLGLTDTLLYPKRYLDHLSGKQIARISQAPNGLEMLKELATPGLKTERATILIKSLEGLLVDSAL